MSDKFLPALSDLKAAILAGEDIEIAIRELADEYALPVTALDNRARRQWGDDLRDYQSKAIQSAGKAKKDAELRRAMALIAEGSRVGFGSLPSADQAWLNALSRNDRLRAHNAACRKVQGLDENGNDPTVGWLRQDGATGLVIACPKCGARHERTWHKMRLLKKTRLRDVIKRLYCGRCGTNVGQEDVQIGYPSGSHPT